MTIRAPAVAGTFYPATPDALNRAVRTALAAAQVESVAAKAIVAPHAGYIYSGPIAGTSFQSVAHLKHHIRRIVLIGPTHRLHFFGIAVPTATGLATPLGTVAIDHAGVDLALQDPNVRLIDAAFDGEEGFFLGETEPYDVVILDTGLPKIDGISVLEQWRRAGRNMPVIILTARDRWSDKVAGRDAGADDYMAKPFHMEELLARIRAQVRRASGHARSDIECGPLRLDTKTARVTLDGQPVKLTSHEYRLLAYLMHHNDRIVSRTELVEHLYEQDFDRDSNTIEVFIGRLRKKIPPDMIKTIRGLGYRLSEGDEN